MHHNQIFARCLILALGLMMAAFAAERCVVAEFAYSEG
jgi:hypothetical protein